MIKKEDIYVKLTKNNIDKVISILEERGYKPNFPNSERLLKNGDNEELYLSYHPISNYCDWVVSSYEPNKKRIKPKQLREILLGEWKTYKLTNSTHDLITGEITFTVATPEEPNKQLEIGKWYKDRTFYKGRLMFKFNGKFGNDAAIGFSNVGEFAKIIGVHKEYINKYEEATPEEVIEAFIYHMEKFADKRRNITTTELRDILNQFHREEISFSKVVELVNKGGR